MTVATSQDILIVDDEVGIRELLSEILQDEGYRVALAENAHQARTYRQRQQPGRARAKQASRSMSSSRPEAAASPSSRRAASKKERCESSASSRDGTGTERAETPGSMPIPRRLW